MVEKRLMVLADFPEERWPSMDLCAEMLVRHLTAEQDQHFRVCRWCPPFRHRLDRLPILKKRAFNADRLINRFWDYPRALRARVGCFDLFHIADHSYSQLALALPPGRTGVFCYDLDAFRCLL
ncbi:MAG: glycosyltransferase family 1 protein, partial [Planctomycetes bacterium]|nr:glycosyltransferase family 1 protein [Planctomycetota bacterium]